MLEVHMQECVILISLVDEYSGVQHVRTSTAFVFQQAVEKLENSNDLQWTVHSTIKRCWSVFFFYCGEPVLKSILELTPLTEKYSQVS